MTCSSFIYKGKKLNSRKEDVLGKNYKGIKYVGLPSFVARSLSDHSLHRLMRRIIRFTMKCPTCSAKFCMQTDPEHMDYAVEHGVVRNFEPWRQNEAKIQAALTKRAEEEKYDAVRALENRTLDSKRQMDQLDALEELKAIRATQSALSPDDLLEFLAQRDRDFNERIDDGSESVAGSTTGSLGWGSVGAGVRRSGASDPTDAANDEADAVAAREAFQQRRLASAVAGVKRIRDEDNDAPATGAADSLRGAVVGERFGSRGAADRLGAAPPVLLRRVPPPGDGPSRQLPLLRHVTPGARGVGLPLGVVPTAARSAEARAATTLTAGKPTLCGDDRAAVMVDAAATPGGTGAGGDRGQGQPLLAAAPALAKPPSSSPACAAPVARASKGLVPDYDDASSSEGEAA